MFTEKDLNDIKEKGLTIAAIERQLVNFERGFPFFNIVKPATPNNGIIQLPVEAVNKLVDEYPLKVSEKTIVKFTPASGAATRMFKKLHELNRGIINVEDLDSELLEIFDNIDKFAFYEELKSKLNENGYAIDDALKNKDYLTIAKFILDKPGLNYGNLPKGLLKFHQYGDYSRTPFEEHIIEGIEYCQNGDRKVKLHFTISPEHHEAFENHLNETKAYYESEFNIKLDISFSYQKPSTDTIAVEPDLTPFREDSGEILFRPGGHGALIENLNETDADLVFIKNIDNVVPDHLKETTYTYKKVLGSVLVDYQNKIFSALKKLENENISDNELDEINTFVEEQLYVHPYDKAENKEELIAYLKQKLDRPLRVCGMVKNLGEPGGGPFWAINADESVSLHIVESAQIDLNNPVKKNIFSESTHFNPVDIACGLKNYKGEKYDLLNHIDHNAGFITKKSRNGREIIAQELPGLWNGAMSDWNTIFVEVPLITFNPVKTVNYLLRDQHQINQKKNTMVEFA
ncbi:DUF4301 family protein [Aureibacter tunicatorum]|uniref:DUF4301 domain-containing protein n=1 Tax=Aureibacter tunicatorum TaxID=866807 RepID=A0AAE3XMD5_9BACT|nr:DUF4301 family protein [Aureibacter tunicatorum]MDR6239107.1 hypothetical protein [Aureibacter tunicatorum]BDD04967.1 hypothetical protein AUTU_24500 [Aureibacter tunicatorum]